MVMGAPFASKVKDSLECISCGVRILFTTFPKSFLAGRQTWDALLGTFAWSMKMLLLGVTPSSRHDGKPWKANDVGRAKKGGNALGFAAGLLQVRGDWAFYQEVCESPGWQSKQCCWRCCAKMPQRSHVISESAALRLSGGSRDRQGICIWLSKD